MSIIENAIVEATTNVTAVVVVSDNSTGSISVVQPQATTIVEATENTVSVVINQSYDLLSIVQPEAQSVLVVCLDLVRHTQLVFHRIQPVVMSLI